MPLDDLLADREPDPGARVFVAGVQPLKDLENPLGLPRLDADAVIAHREPPVSRFALGGDVNPRRRFAAKLERVTDQVLEHQA